MVWSYAWIVCVLMMMPLYTHAHVIGKSFENEDGVYKIDIGYSPDILVSQESAVFTLALYKDQVSIPYDDAWVRIVKKKGEMETTMFATGIHSFGSVETPVTLTFPSAGDYVLSVRFEKGDSTIAKAEFPIGVEGSSGAVGMTFWEWVTYAALGSFAAGVATVKLKLKFL